MDELEMFKQLLARALSAADRMEITRVVKGDSDTPFLFIIELKDERHFIRYEEKRPYEFFLEIKDLEAKAEIKSSLDEFSKAKGQVHFTFGSTRKLYNKSFFGNKWKPYLQKPGFVGTLDEVYGHFGINDFLSLIAKCRTRYHQG